MNAKIFVGGISFQMSQDELSEALRSEPFGLTPMGVKLIIDRETGQSRGFAFVEFGSEKEAEGAIGLLDGAEVGGRQLRAEWATEKSKSQSQRGRR